MNNLEKLLGISSVSLAETQEDLLSEQRNSLVGYPLSWMLQQKNGFFAFESSLHVFPFSTRTKEMTIQKWNAPTLWKDAYELDFGSLLFFAEDVFGNQFGMEGGHVKRFESESGFIEDHSDNLDEWANLILDDYHFETGFDVSHEWQKANGILPPGKRLAPKTPFIVGGDYTTENLYAADSIEIMRFRGDLFNQLKNVSDGTQIEIRVI